MSHCGWMGASVVSSMSQIILQCKQVNLTQSKTCMAGRPYPIGLSTISRAPFSVFCQFALELLPHLMSLTYLCKQGWCLTPATWMYLAPQQGIKNFTTPLEKSAWRFIVSFQITSHFPTINSIGFLATSGNQCLFSSCSGQGQSYYN